jgi:hypothetical protein
VERPRGRLSDPSRCASDDRYGPSLLFLVA